MSIGESISFPYTANIHTSTCTATLSRKVTTCETREEPTAIFVLIYTPRLQVLINTVAIDEYGDSLARG